MKRIAIIGANSFQNKLILKAREMGYETHVFAWAAGDVGEKTADYFYPISIVEKEQILEKCKELKIDAICSIASDLAVLTVNYVAREMGLTANSEISDNLATNKFEMREAFEQAGIRTPKHLKITYENCDSINYSLLSFPVIVKPTDRSGSRAITKVENPENIQQAIELAIEQSFEKAAIVEEFIEGKEFSCECVSFKGRHHWLAFTEKFTTGAPHYIEKGHIEPAPIREENEDNIRAVIFKALDALKIEFGASHTEFRLDKNGNVGIIEIGARMGGDCIGSDLVYLSTGVDFVKAVIQVALGEEPELTKLDTNRYAGVRFLMNEQDVNMMNGSLSNKLNIVEKQVEVGDYHEVVDSSSRLGYFIFTSEDDNGLMELFD